MIDTALKVPQPLHCFTTFMCHGVENYFPRLWGTGISDAILHNCAICIDNCYSLINKFYSFIIFSLLFIVVILLLNCLVFILLHAFPFS